MLTSADFQFEFREPQSLPNPMLAFADVACGYRNEESGEVKRIVDHIDRSVLAGQRIGILGANGQGKSTFVKTIAGDLAPLAGEIVAGKGLTIGYFAQQELDVLSPADGPLMHMVRLARDVGPAAREQELRDFLGSFRFTGEMVQQAVGTLSGGEKARLVLAMLVWQRPNLLLLDEPTNHLDLTTREALSMALNEFEGTVMLVSHDRALLREVCDEFWLVTRGGLEPFDGDLDDYQRWLLEQSKAAAKAARPEAAPSPRGADKKPASKAPAVAKTAGVTPPAELKLREDRKSAAAARQQRADAAKPLRKELNQIDNRLGVLFAERDALEAPSAERDDRRRGACRERPAPEGDRRADRAARGALARAQHAARRHRRIDRLNTHFAGDPMKPDKILYTAHATSTGGREGTSKSDDGVLDVKLTTPKGLGGNGAVGTNPEQLFAAGYSACFIGAMKHVAMLQKTPLPADTSITADVGIGPIPNGFGIQVALHVSIPGMDKAAGAEDRRGGAPGVPVLERHPRQHRGDARRRLAPRWQRGCGQQQHAGSARRAPAPA